MRSLIVANAALEISWLQTFADIRAFILITGQVKFERLDLDLHVAHMALDSYFSNMKIKQPGNHNRRLCMSKLVENGNVETEYAEKA